MTHILEFERQHPQNEVIIMAEEDEIQQSFKDKLKIGTMSLTQSLAIWGLFALVVLALLLAIIATFTGQNERGF